MTTALPQPYHDLVEDSHERMRMATEVSKLAMVELGAITRHRERTTVETLSEVDDLYRSAQDRGIVTEEITAHLLQMRHSYLDSQRQVTTNASRRIVRLADAPSGQVGLAQLIRRIAGSKPVAQILPSQEADQ